MTSNFELIDIAKRIKLPLVGVFSKDDLPLKKRGNYIVNMQDSDAGGGTHWVALCMKKDFAYYFDSFGFPPPVEVVEWLPKRNKALGYSEAAIQHRDSPNCGYYCVYLLACLHRNEDYNEVIDRFVDGSGNEVNDERLQGFLNALVK